MQSYIKIGETPNKNDILFSRPAFRLFFPALLARASNLFRTFAKEKDKDMNPPFKLLGLMVCAKRPRRIKEMKAVRDGFWLRGNYAALTFFGYIVVHSQQEADRINARTTDESSLKRHETIHLRQALSTHNSWLCFYTLYIWYYLRALPQNRHRRNAAYYLNPFEMEAYEHMYERDYIEKCRNGANGWRVYAKMKPRERLKIAKS